MRASGIVDADRDGREVRYRLADPDVMEACALMRRVLERRLRRLADLSVTRPGEPSAGLPTPGLPTPAFSTR
jgi:hypothetical protein